MRPLLSGESEATTPGAIGAWAPVLPPGSVKAERQIVEALGVPYLEPHERCHP